MKNIDAIQDDPKFEEFCQLAYYFQEAYGVRVWHSNVFPAGDPSIDIVTGFYDPLKKCGFNLDNEVYCYGSPK